MLQIEFTFHPEITEQWLPSARSTNDISTDFFEKNAMLWFKMSSTHHNKILHTSRQLHSCNMHKILLWSLDHILI